MRRRLAIALALAAALTLTTPFWKPWAKRFKWFVIATNAGQDLLRRAVIVSGQIGLGQSKPDLDVALELARAERMYQNYLRYSRLTPLDLRDKRVLEMGPGFAIAVPLEFLARGASFAVAVDRFVPFQDSPQHQELYTRLRARLTPEEQLRFDGAISLDSKPAPKPERLKYIYGIGIEEAALEPGSLDIIFSNAVLEEIYDLNRTFAAMDLLLAPSGYLLHKIDLTDYGMFAKHGFHPLEFLTVPDWAYRFMVEASGQPNRWLVNQYREQLTRRGYAAEIYVTEVLGGGKMEPGVPRLERGVHYQEPLAAGVEAIRPRLLERYRHLPIEDLLTAGIYLVGRKPQ